MTAPLRALPITSPPAAFETITSYLRRLERINHLEHRALTEIVAEPLLRRSPRQVTAEMIDIRALGALSGYAPGLLRRALPELWRPALDWKVFQHDPLPACPRCVHRPGGQVIRFFPMHTFVCLRHRLWVGGQPSSKWGRTRPYSGLDLGPLPEVLAAQRRNHRLVRRYGPVAAAQALRIAQGSLDYWHEHAPLRGAQRRRLDAVLPPDWERITLEAPAYIASYYPEIVSLAGLLLSPHWQAVAADQRMHDELLAEIGRRTDRSRVWIDPKDPLEDWLDQFRPPDRTDLPDAAARLIESSWADIFVSANIRFTESE